MTPISNGPKYSVDFIPSDSLADNSYIHAKKSGRQSIEAFKFLLFAMIAKGCMYKL